MRRQDSLQPRSPPPLKEPKRARKRKGFYHLSQGGFQTVSFCGAGMIEAIAKQELDRFKADTPQNG